MTSAPASPALEPPPHGADLEAASARYGIPLSDWLDLSAAINPCMYPFAALPNDALRQLPYSLRAAQDAAKNYCSAPVLPVFAAGSQVLIQWLPLVHRNLHSGRRVAVPRIGYAEHAFRWRWAGYEIVFYDPRTPEQVDELLQRDAIDVLVVITPHNPLAHRAAPQQLLRWHAALQRHRARGNVTHDTGAHSARTYSAHTDSNSGKWLIVDEAFADATPESSLTGMADRPGIVVLRSFGKFFGAAGARCGYAFCHPSIGEPLEIAIGPWPLATTALAIATQALRDSGWQRAMRTQLAQSSAQNAELLASASWASAGKIHRHALFNSVELRSTQAVAIEDYFAQRAIRVRRIDIDADTALLRLGLVHPADTQGWPRLAEAIASSC